MTGVAASSSRPVLRFSRSDHLTVLDNTQLTTSGVLSTSELAALEAACDNPREIGVGEWLSIAGEPSSHLHVLTEGWAARSLSKPDGTRQIVAILLPGEVCNLDDLTLDRAFCDLRMLTSGRAVSLPIERARALGRRHSGIGDTYIRLGVRERVALSRTALSLGRRMARERIASLLCDLSNRLGTRDFDLPLTQDQLADAVGLTSIHVCRVLGELENAGLIERSAKRMILSDEHELRRIGGFDPDKGVVPLVGSAKDVSETLQTRPLEMV